MRGFLLAACLAALPALSATDPAAPGPFLVGQRNVDIPVESGEERNADVYYPSADGGVTVDPAAGRLPAVVFGHGFSRTKDRYNDVGTHLASRGFLVVIPNFACGIFQGCDHSANADEMSDVLDWIVARDTDESSIFLGRIATDRLGTSGHSAGGLQSLVCASRDDRVRASAPMDPVDNGGLGAGSLPAVAKPIAITFSEPSSCNANGSAEDLYAAANPQKRGVKLVGANHCDPEKDVDLLGCALTCGFWDAERHERYLRYVTGWFEYYLRCDGSYREWVWGDRVASDLSSGLITYDSDPTPPAPTGLSASWTGAAVLLERDPPLQCQGVEAWRVYRREGISGPLTLVADGLDPSITSWEDGETQSGVSYTYIARDLFSDFQSSAESLDSNEAEISTPGAKVPQEASPAAAPMLASSGFGTAIEITYRPADCALDHVVYWGQAAAPLASLEWTEQVCGLGASGSASFDPGAPPAGAWLYFVIVGNDGSQEGSYGTDSEGRERPEASGLSLCDYPLTTGDCSP
jgi:dienelactone hydrolase